MRNIFQNMKAVHLRHQGKTISEIQQITNVPRSTLQDWFKKMRLRESGRLIIEERKKQANLKARRAAFKARRGFEIKEF